MGYLDQEKITKIKQILKWRPRGMTISDLSSQMKSEQKSGCKIS